MIRLGREHESSQTSLSTVNREIKSLRKKLVYSNLRPRRSPKLRGLRLEFGSGLSLFLYPSKCGAVPTPGTGRFTGNEPGVIFKGENHMKTENISTAFKFTCSVYPCQSTELGPQTVYTRQVLATIVH